MQEGSVVAVLTVVEGSKGVLQNSWECHIPGNPTPIQVFGHKGAESLMLSGAVLELGME